MSLREVNVSFLIKSLGGAIDTLPGYYLDKMGAALAVKRRQDAAKKRAERARKRIK